MIENRQHFRLRKQFDIAWSIPDQNTQGEGMVLNISESGMLFLAENEFNPRQGLKMCFKVQGVPSFPAEGKLLWYRPMGKGQAQHQCGVRFSKEFIQDQQWVKWMEDNISKLADIGDNKILNRFLAREMPE